MGTEASQAREAVEGLCRDLYDEGYQIRGLGDGNLEISKLNGDDTEREIIQPDTFAASTFEEQRTRESDTPTASEAPPGPPIPEPEHEGTEAAEKKADELGVDINTVQGTGKDGRVTVADVEKASS